MSTWFTKARAYVESAGGRWFILSAKHGLLTPDDWVEPYNLTLADLRAPARRAWAQRVLHSLAPRIAPADRVVILAGARYREHLVPGLRARLVQVDLPFEGLGIGEQLRWLTNATARTSLTLEPETHLE